VTIPSPKHQAIGVAALYVLLAWWPFRFELPYTVVNGAVVDEQGVTFENPGLLRADAGPLVRGVRASPGQVFWVKLRVRPASLDQYGPARILEIGQDHYRMNLMIGQSGDAIVARVRRPESDAAGSPPLMYLGALTSGCATKLAVAVGPDRIELYVDGQLVDARRTATPVDVWSEDAVLTAGDSPIGERAWLGRIEQARLELGGIEMLDLLEEASDTRPSRILRVPERLRLMLELGGFPPLNGVDMSINFLGFLPLGFIAARAWRRRPLRGALLLVVGTSTTMEVGQIAFATRVPALPDLILNISGGTLGAILFARAQRADRV
jgi:hypothetical protein